MEHQPTTKNFFITLGITFILINIVAMLFWFFKKDNSLTDYNDRLFLTTITVASVGFIVAITSKSRLHYYTHLRKKFTGKTLNDHSFEEAEVKRGTFTIFGMGIGIAGVLGIVESILLLYV